MRKLTLGRFPDMSITEVRNEAALLARIWAGEAVAPAPKTRSLLFTDFATRYRERCKYRWKLATFETRDIYMHNYMRNRLMPAFGRLGLDTIDHARALA